MAEVLGTCIWCGHSLVYASPAVTGQGTTDAEGFYQPANTWNDYSLIDSPLDFGKFCPSAPPHPLGQFTVHQLGSNPQQPLGGRHAQEH